ncbi:CDK2-associated and cullin domain-containing protein 1-like [Saccopteryx leptura]|uniref:CDK2-associated and cullin domain-containing protein 1-like n=1 Tax=Saccopteryx leptura TaxID=249018 RepID=UPI00339BF3A0
MRLSVRAPRRARPELFVNYISGAFIAPAPQTPEKPPPPPRTASRAPDAPASRRPGGLRLSDPGFDAREGWREPRGGRSVQVPGLCRRLPRTRGSVQAAQAAGAAQPDSCQGAGR